jgi:hypothetical protein
LDKDKVRKYSILILVVFVKTQGKDGKRQEFGRNDHLTSELGVEKEAI